MVLRYGRVDNGEGHKTNIYQVHSYEVGELIYVCTGHDFLTTNNVDLTLHGEV